MIKSLPHAAPLLLAALMTPALNAADNKPPSASARIDQILHQHHQRLGLAAGPDASDEVFLRRVYIDVAGRLPTLDEARSFLSSVDPAKRARLIDDLLASPASTSRLFHFFADLLRVLTNNRDGLTGQAYADWLKRALAENKPYDVLVRELITADGSSWDNGAIGFYMRDRGMPLDHLAATVQVFLGTRLECAQCHNHPFDKWTQMDYYKLAAFTYGVDTRGDYGFDRSAFMRAAGESNDPRRFRQMNPAARQTLQAVRQTIGDATRPLRYTTVSLSGKLPRLPHDYAYDDASPNDLVEPAVIFGHETPALEGESRVERFARWMTSPDNPRFTTVIANRLWKMVMGAGLIEPVDEMMDSSAAVIPELMAHLEQVMKAGRYDTREFLRVVLNSAAYQRMPAETEPEMGSPWHFTAPVMRRLSAEQVWDSLVTLITGSRDLEAVLPDPAAASRLNSLRQLAGGIRDQSPSELIARTLAMQENSGAELERRRKELTAQAAEARKAGDLATARRISQQTSRLRNESRDNALEAVLGEDAAGEFRRSMRESRSTGNPAGRRPAAARARFDRSEAMALMEAGKSRDEVRQIMNARIRSANQAASQLGPLERASALPSPAPRGHFLRVFGQSDRETIDNANPEASVPQALNLLNGAFPAAILAPHTAFAQAITGLSTWDEKVDAIYLSLLTRLPTAGEREILATVPAARGDKAVADVVHALLNAGEFLFSR
jgi:hypothetical protein